MKLVMDKKTETETETIFSAFHKRFANKKQKEIAKRVSG
jgi:hypothetical protein